MDNARGIPAFSQDGRRIALLGADGSFGVWDVEPWGLVTRWQGAEESEHGLVFDPPGKRIFVACHNKGLVVGDTETHALTWFPQEHRDAISHIDISRDNHYVATSSWDGTVNLWAFPPGEKPRFLAKVVNQRTSAWSVAFSPDGRRLAVGLADGRVQLWDFRRQMLVGVLKGHQQPVWDLAFNPGDDTLVSVSPDELRVWRVTGQD
jgi:WD40 repeat protein